jgi:hypothetical protein
MPGMKILSAFLIMAPAAVLLTAEASLAEPAAEACKPSPTGPAPRGAHWYFHVNRATKQQCWYLGQAGGRIKSHARLAGVADPVAAARPADLADPNDAASAQSGPAPLAAPPAAQSTPADVGQAGMGQTGVGQADVGPASAAPAPALQVAQPQPASPQAAAASAATAAQPVGVRQAGAEQFGTRWPENLPKTEDLLQSDPAPVSDSYAERHDLDSTGQMPSKWPVAKAGASVGATVLHYFTIAGILAIPLLLLAGWLAKYARRPLRSEALEQTRSAAQGSRPRRRAAIGEAEFAEPEPGPVIRRRTEPDRDARVLTDPAQDLKASLSELMRDLRRAGEPDAPPRRAAARSGGPLQEHQERLHQEHLQDRLHEDDDHNERALGSYLEAAE